MESFDSKPTTVSLDDIEIPVKAVLRRLGYPVDGKLEGRVKSLFEEELRRAPEYFRPRGVYRILEADCIDEGIVTMKGEEFRIRSRGVAKMLRNSDHVVLLMTTLGPGLEEEVKRLFGRDRMAEAVILDAIGSETADAAADEIHHRLLQSVAENKGFRITPRFSPGYGDWPVTVQNAFLTACRGDLVGISVNDSSLMHPRKSVSAVLGFEKNLN